MPSGDRMGRRVLSKGEMLVGQVLALLYLDPATVQSGGSVTRADLLARLDMLLGADVLARTLQPRQRRFDARIAEETVRSKVDEALRALDGLGFVDIREAGLLRLRSALLRFADPVRGREELGAALERLVVAGDVVLDESEDSTIDKEPS